MAFVPNNDTRTMRSVSSVRPPFVSGPVTVPLSSKTVATDGARVGVESMVIFNGAEATLMFPAASVCLAVRT